MATITTISVTTERSILRDGHTGQGSKREVAVRLGTVMNALASGARGGTALMVATNSVQATGTVTLSSASGTVGATINGVSTTVSASGGDTATATALAAAINASSNALVNKHVTASSALGVVTLTAIRAGHPGNAITLAATGTGATASGARLTGGTSDTPLSYTF